MNTALKVVGWTFAVGVLFSALLIAGAIWAAGSVDAGTFSVDGEQLFGGGLGEGLMAIGGIGLAALICALVVPVAVLVPLTIVAIVLLGVGVALVGVLAVLFSPLWLVLGAVWLIWRLAHRARRAEATTGGATIAG